MQYGSWNSLSPLLSLKTFATKERKDSGFAIFPLDVLNLNKMLDKHFKMSSDILFSASNSRSSKEAK